MNHQLLHPSTHDLSILFPFTADSQIHQGQTHCKQTDSLQTDRLTADRQIHQRHTHCKQTDALPVPARRKLVTGVESEIAFLAYNRCNLFHKIYTKTR